MQAEPAFFFSIAANKILLLANTACRAPGQRFRGGPRGSARAKFIIQHTPNKRQRYQTKGATQHTHTHMRDYSKQTRAEMASYSSTVQREDYRTFFSTCSRAFLD